jgi:hypothetical protein
VLGFQRGSQFLEVQMMRGAPDFLSTFLDQHISAPTTSYSAPSLPLTSHSGVAAGTVMEEAKGICSKCGKTVFGHQERGKDQKGSYFHMSCVGVSAAGTHVPHYVNQISRLSDIAHEPLGLLNPIMGISDTPRQPLMTAAMASGVADMDAHGCVAAEHGAAQARCDPHGLDADEAAALTF